MDNLHWKNERFLESNFTNGGASKGDGQVVLKLLSQNWNVVDEIKKTDTADSYHEREYEKQSKVDDVCKPF